MGKLKDISYTPNTENAAVYEKLYAEYKELVHYFGKENHVMKRLKTIKIFNFQLPPKRIHKG